MMAEWKIKIFCGARFWSKTVGPDRTIRARVHETPEGDYYWDVRVCETGIIDQGRVSSLAVAQTLAAEIAGRANRKQAMKRSER